MDAPELESMYRRWLSEVWGQGRIEVAAELLADDLIDHNPYPGQPPGAAGHHWAVAMVRKAFPDLRFAADLVMSDGPPGAAPAATAGRTPLTADLAAPMAVDSLGRTIQTGAERQRRRPCPWMRRSSAT